MPSKRTNHSQLKTLILTIGLLGFLLLIPYRITSGTSPSAVHTWIMSLLWQIHFDQISTTVHYTIRSELMIIFLLIATPALYFHISLQIRKDGAIPKIPAFLSLLVPLILDYLISNEDDLSLPFTLSRYDWQSLYAFSLVILTIMVFIPLLVNALPIGYTLRPKFEAVVIVLSVIVLPSVVVGVGRMFTHYTYDEAVLYSPLWTALVWERSGAFYSASEFVYEFNTIPELAIAIGSYLHLIVFILEIFRNYGKMNSRRSTIAVGLIGLLASTFCYYLLTLMSPDIGRVYVYALPIPITFILGMLILKFSYPKYQVSSSEYSDRSADDLENTESEDLLEISLFYRFLSWLRRRE